MSDVIDIEDFRPCFTIHGKNNIHIVPVVCFEKVIGGGMEIEEIDEWEDIFIGILMEWMGLDNDDEE